MKKWFKRIVVSCVVLLVVAFIGVAVFILNLDPTAYKNKLAQLIKEQYNRELVVDGDINLSLFPRIGLSLEDVSLSEQGSSTVFADIKHAKMAVALWPLMSNRFLVDHLDIDGFNMHIEKDENGKFNFDNLLDFSLAKSVPIIPNIHSLNKTVSERVEQTDFKIDIAGLTLNNGQVTLQDKQRDYNVQLQNMGVRTGRITAGQAFDLNLNADVKGDKPDVDSKLVLNGLMLLNPQDNKYEFNRLKADLKGRWNDLDLTETTAEGSVVFDSNLNALVGKNLELTIQGNGLEKSTIDTLSAGFEAPVLNYDVPKISLALNNFNVKANVIRKDKQTVDINFGAPELNISPEVAGGEPVKGKVSVNTLQQQLNLEILLDKISGTASSLRVKNVQVKGLYNVDKSHSLKLNLESPGSISLFEQSIDLPTILGNIELNEQPKGRQVIPLTGNIQTFFNKQQTNFLLNALLSQGDISVTGSVKNLFKPQVTFDVQAKEFDLEAFLNDLSAPLKELVKDKPSTEVAPVTAAKQVKPSSETSHANVEQKQALTVKQLLLSRLSGVGTFNFQKVTYDNLILDDLGATLNFDYNNVNVKSVRANLFGGSVYANGAYTVDQQYLEGDINLSDIQSQKIFDYFHRDSFIETPVKAKILFSSQGSSDDELIKNMVADIDLESGQGTLKGLNLESILKNPEDYMNPWNLKVPLVNNPDEQMAFNKIKLVGKIKNELLTIQQGIINSSAVDFKTKEGEANFQLASDYLYVPGVIETKVPLKVKKGLVTVQVKKATLPILIEGKLSDLKAQLDVGTLVVPSLNR
ncbi:AsmA family protein [Pelistega sp. MC2]|uniref:AsmA family protein n=1 Tax=Pelistega sp. MC2 TaxID=1720297 RepID=UPI0008D965C5|nr:AsmA family protein [Pelistega sp. MC2]